MKYKLSHTLETDYRTLGTGDLIHIPFYCFTGKAKNTSTHTVQMVAHEFGSGEASIEDVIEKLDILDHPFERLKFFIRDDFRLGFGIDFPEYKLFSVDAKFPEMHPIMAYKLNESGQMKYIAHPQISLMVQRYKLK